MGQCPGVLLADLELEIVHVDSDDTIVIDFVVVTPPTSDNARIERGQPFALEFSMPRGFAVDQALATIRRWERQSRSLTAASATDDSDRFLFVLGDGEEEWLLLEVGGPRNGAGHN